MNRHRGGGKDDGTVDQDKTITDAKNITDVF